MGKEVVYCAGCGNRIPASDFDKGFALTVQKRHLCNVCAVTVVKESPEGDAPDPTATPKPLKARTTKRSPLAKKPGLDNFPTPFLISGALLLAATLLLLVVLFLRSGQAH